MKMAINELNSLCRSALEGSGWAQGDYEDAADAAVWLQAMGFDGMDAVGGLLGALHHEDYSVEPALPGARGASAARPRSSSGLAGCLLSFELAWARATQAGAATVRISNALSPRLALYGLKAMGARGRRFDLSWTDQAGRHFATTSGHDEYPTYLGLSTQTGTTAQEIVVCCMAHADACETPPATGQHLAGAIDSAELDARYRDALWRGIEVDASQVDRLIAWKSRVLVPATRASREHGAGGADDGF
ncbi:hypothetical protein R70006_07543 [Paraburkholderia domus]|jgi:Protein of unknown function (DUF3726).|uniref:DUF3726 domain-containing protein n=1 Tax=Paraburkholderia domus TaxID=2793075 RepID=UPI001913B555|nr:DUF3726 domain-containing protein [Paraburkholderia domus]MBK5054019.1 DUF3726 domain-containing protein [Burkholderia sp. R-70006]CAE6850594.1 hypothetical protein R70006_07543 [Paraburkholderia domus]